MTSHLKKGDIIRGSKNAKTEAYHPIIYLEEYNSEFFLGVMLTHADKYGNIELKDKHFLVKPPSSNNKPSYFVNHHLLKREEWEPFFKCGEISIKGLIFIERHLGGSTPTIWEDYLKK